MTVKTSKYSTSMFFNLVITLAVKTIKLKYKNSLLGFLWSMINPLMYLLIFTFIFSNVFLDVDRYPLYALIGIVFWSFFSTSTIQVIESIINSSGVLKSINIPAIAFPLGAQIAAVFSLLLTLVPFTILMMVFGLQVGWETFLFIPILILFSLFTFGISLLLTSINVYFRDVQLAWSSLLPAIFYSAPIAYASNLIPSNYVWLVKLNPLYYFINILRDVLYDNTLPNLHDFLVAFALSFVFFGLGIIMFNRLKKGFVSQF
jgi:ABC-type polysaccharide/polyol phosphate export permease